MNDPITIHEVAVRMIDMHRNSSYKVAERTADHAFSHDRGPSRDFWLAVRDEIVRLEKSTPRRRGGYRNS